METRGKKVDQDWKEQVQKEKKRVADPTEGSAGSEASTAPPASKERRQQLPPVDFRGFITGMALQALMALGQLDTPEGKSLPPDLPQAKHLIDTLDLLKKKTQGNLTKEEQDFFEEWLYRLRMIYAEVVQLLSSKKGETK